MNEIHGRFLPEFISMNYLQRDRFLIEHGTYDFWNLFILMDGTFTCGKNNDTVRPGDVVFFAPNEPFSRRVIEPISFLSIHFDWQTISDDGQKYEAKLPRGKVSFKDDRRIISTAKLMQSASRDHVCDHYLRDIWHQYCIESDKTTRLTLNRTVDEALQLIGDGDNIQTCISEIADRLGISHAHLINLFKSTLGVTPSEYISELRIERAKALLLESEYGIDRIAELCGFANLYYFSAAFKKHTGIPPSLFRRIYRT